MEPLGNPFPAVVVWGGSRTRTESKGWGPARILSETGGRPEFCPKRGAGQNFLRASGIPPPQGMPFAKHGSGLAKFIVFLAETLQPESKKCSRHSHLAGLAKFCVGNPWVLLISAAPLVDLRNPRPGQRNLGFPGKNRACPNFWNISRNSGTSPGQLPEFLEIFQKFGQGCDL